MGEGLWEDPDYDRKTRWESRYLRRIGARAGAALDRQERRKIVGNTKNHQIGFAQE